MRAAAVIPPGKALALLRAAAIPVQNRRALAARYGEYRRAGRNARCALAAVAQHAAQAFDISPSVVAAAIFRGVWECPTCGRTSYRLAGGVRRYIDGGEPDPCCEKRDA